jgi:hypothetical protein
MVAILHTCSFWLERYIGQHSARLSRLLPAVGLIQQAVEKAVHTCLYDVKMVAQQIVEMEKAHAVWAAAELWPACYLQKSAAFSRPSQPWVSSIIMTLSRVCNRLEAFVYSRWLWKWWSERQAGSETVLSTNKQFAPRASPNVGSFAPSCVRPQASLSDENNKRQYAALC